MTTKPFPFVNSKIKLTNYNYNRGVFFDEKKQRFVDFDDMDYLTYENYNRPFTTVSLKIKISIDLTCMDSEAIFMMPTFTDWLNTT